MLLLNLITRQGTSTLAYIQTFSIFYEIENSLIFAFLGIEFNSWLPPLQIECFVYLRHALGNQYYDITRNCVLVSE